MKLYAKVIIMKQTETEKLHAAKLTFIKLLQDNGCYDITDFSPEDPTDSWNYYASVSGHVGDLYFDTYFKNWKGAISIDYRTESGKYNDLTIPKFLEYIKTIEFNKDKLQVYIDAICPNENKLTIDSDNVVANIVDEELDPIGCKFDGDDCVELDTSEYSHLILHRNTLLMLVELIDQAEDHFSGEYTIE